MEQINAVGRRKTSVARVYLTQGKGNIVVNAKDLKQYFPSEQLQSVVQQPLARTELLAAFDAKINVQGGGLTGQAEASRLGIARALCKLEATHRPVLKEAGYLRRDPRMVERKKYGRSKARKKFQFSKR